MGITCKPVGKFRSILKRIDNELEKERKLEKEKNLDKNKLTKAKIIDDRQ